MLRGGALIAGRFELGAELGRGGMGVVHRAIDRAANRPVALKLLVKHADPRHRARFEREGQLMAALRHPGIVTVHAAGTTDDGVPYLACELVEGARPITDAARDAPLRRRVELVRDAARALGHAHARGVVHRDVKPENLLVGADGVVRVADLGVAIGADSERLTKTGHVVGTPFYLAPERLEGKREEVAAASDVWALGVTLYQLVTGELPYPTDSFLSFVGASARPPAPPSSLAPDVPRELDAVVLAALAPAPADRPRDGAALAAELDRWLGGEQPLAAVQHEGQRRALVLGLGALALLTLLVPAVALLSAAPPAEPLPPATIAATRTRTTATVAPAAPALVGPWALTPSTTLEYDLKLEEVNEVGDPVMPNMRMAYEFRARLRFVAGPARDGATPFTVDFTEGRFFLMGVEIDHTWMILEPFELLLEPDGRVRAISGVDRLREKVLSHPLVLDSWDPKRPDTFSFYRFARDVFTDDFLTRTLGLLLHPGPPWEPGPIDHVLVLPAQRRLAERHLLPVVFTHEFEGQTLWHRRDDVTHAGEPIRSELRLDPTTGRVRRARVFEWADYTRVEQRGPMLQPIAIWSIAQAERR